MKFTPKTLLGYWPACPLCGDEKPEVKADAKGNPYLWCKNPNCNVQIFTQGKGDRPKNMIAKMTPVDAAGTAAPGGERSPADPAPAGTAAAGDASSSTPPKRGIFTTLIG